MVLLHGGGSTISTSFGRILPELAKTHQVIAIELQAHGHTGDRNAPETFGQDGRHGEYFGEALFTKNNSKEPEAFVEILNEFLAAR